MNLALTALLFLAVNASVAAAAVEGAAGSARQWKNPIKRVDTSEPTVALTFDACATKTQANNFDHAVLDVLRAEKVPATIFASGRWVEAHPEVMRELAVDPLLEFGGHSYQHPHMGNLSAARIAEEIDQTDAVLARYGKKSVGFRPPFGEWSPRVLSVVNEKRMPMVLWDVVSGDPSSRVTAEGMTREVLRQTKPGSIVIFHINGRGLKTAEALPDILRGLRARGLRFVFLSELLARRAPLLVASPAKSPAPIPGARIEPPPFSPKPLGAAQIPAKPVPVAAVVPATPPTPAPAPRAPAATPSAPLPLPAKPVHPDDTLPLSVDLLKR